MTLWAPASKYRNQPLRKVKRKLWALCSMKHGQAALGISLLVTGLSHWALRVLGSFCAKQMLAPPATEESIDKPCPFLGAPPSSRSHPTSWRRQAPNAMPLNSFDTASWGDTRFTIQPAAALEMFKFPLQRTKHRVFLLPKNLA